MLKNSVRVWRIRCICFCVSTNRLLSSRAFTRCSYSYTHVIITTIFFFLFQRTSVVVQRFSPVLFCSTIVLLMTTGQSRVHYRTICITFFSNFEPPGVFSMQYKNNSNITMARGQFLWCAVIRHESLPGADPGFLCRGAWMLWRARIASL